MLFTIIDWNAHMMVAGYNDGEVLAEIFRIYATTDTYDITIESDSGSFYHMREGFDIDEFREWLCMFD